MKPSQAPHSSCCLSNASVSEYPAIRSTALRLRMRELALLHVVGTGTARSRVLLIRKVWQVGKKLVYRLYREEGHGLRSRRKSRRTVSEHSRQKPRAERPNQVWGWISWPISSSTADDSERLTVLDVYKRECLAIEVGQRLKGPDVVGVLQHISQERGAPQMLFCDNGSEFTSQVLDRWAYHNQVKIDFSRPGKSTDHAYVDTSTGRWWPNAWMLIGSALCRRPAS